MQKHRHQQLLEILHDPNLPTVASVFFCILTVAGLLWLMLVQQPAQLIQTVDNFSIPDSFARQLSLAQENSQENNQRYQLNDKQLIAPRPNPSCYGKAQEPSSMQNILSRAYDLFAMDHTLFTADTPIIPGSTIHYYLDESIFVVTWKQTVGNSTYTFSEIKIRNSSQFRRFFSDGYFGSGVLRTTTEMSDTVNAVVASSGDYYGYRSIGIVVNEGQVYRHMGHYLDTCYIDENGDLLFTYAGELKDYESVQQYVNDHNVRFSLSFGPVMIDSGEYRVPVDYNSGEINKPYARAALCQMDKLHYVLVTANMEAPNYSVPTVSDFARNLMRLGIPAAYALDGGQTAAIAMDGKLINQVSYGAQREISDIIYFATAIPET